MPDTESLFLRLVSIESTDLLQSFVTRHLTNILAVLDEAGSEQQTAIELLKHLNVRLKTNVSIVPPLEQLLEVFCRIQSTAFSSNFFTMYLKMGFERIDDEHRRIYLVKFLEASVLKDEAQQNRIFGFVMPALASFALMNQDYVPLTKLRRLLRDNDVLRRNLISFASDVILLPSSSSGDSSQAISAMSAYGYERVKHLENTLDEIKPNILKSLSLFDVTPTELFFPILAGLMTTVHSLLAAAEMEWKRLDWKDLIEDKKLVLGMYNFYLGTLSDARLKLLPFIVRSAAAAAAFPQNIQLVCDGLFGDERPTRMKAMCAEFLSKIVPCVPQKLLPTFGPIIYSAAKKVVTEDTAGGNAAVFSYLALSQVGIRCPYLLAKDIQFIQNVFETAAIQGEDGGARSAAADCLNSWIPPFRDHFDAQAQAFVKALVETYVEHNSARCRLIAMKLVSALFDRSSPATFWLLFVATGDSREDIKTESERILNECLDALDVPKFDEMIEYASLKMSSGGTLSAGIIKTCLLFCRALLLAARDDDGGEAETRPEVVSFRDVDVALSPYVYRRLCTSHTPATALTFLRLTCRLCQLQPDIDVLRMLHEIASSVSAEARKEYLGEDWLKALCGRSSNQESCRLSNELWCWTIDDAASLKKAVDQAVSHMDLSASPSMSTVWLLGCLLARCGGGERQQSDDDDRQLLTAAEGRLFAHLDESGGSSTTLEAATGATAAILRAARGDRCRQSDGRALLFTRLTKIAHSRKEHVKASTKQSAIAALGELAASAPADGGDDDKKFFDDVVGALMKIGEGPPQPELQFSVGDSLCAAAMGEHSPTRRNIWTQTIEDFKKSVKTVPDDRLGSLIDTLINDKLRNQNHHLRKSTITWLYSIMKLCGSWHAGAVNRLESIQGAFIEGLSSDSEFTQDVASRGLELLSDIGTKEQREQMLAILVETLTTGKRPAKKAPLAPDDKVFEKGVIGSAPGGGSLSTYKELCSLATDLNKPDLLYKFMQLANHQSLWNSKKGAAMGFGSILAKTSEDLEPYLPLLVPKLYRYRYDPDTKVRTTMATMWSVLSAKRKGLIDKYADAILKELMKCLTDPQWRTREASCMATSDLLSGHAGVETVERFAELWTILFQVQDDIKESVRIAANRCMTSLGNVTVRYCTEGTGGGSAVVERHIGDILECLLVKGMQSKLKDTKVVSLRTIMELSKKASGKLFRPHLTLIVRRLLESLSETESSVWNYVAVRSNAEDMERIDDARASVARSSAVMDSLSNCVSWIDTTTLTNLCPVLTELLRAASGGLSTRVGVCSFVTLLCTRCQPQLRANTNVADRLLKALTVGARDRNMTLKKTSASTIGHIIRFTSDKAVDQLIEGLRQSFLLNDDQSNESAEASSAYILRSIALNSPESLKNFASDIIPMVLFALNKEPPVVEGKESANFKLWQEIWLEMVPGKEGGMRLYKTEILQFSQKSLAEVSVWTQKAAIFRLLADLASTLSTQLGKADIAIIHDLVSGNISGRYWEGKAEVLNCLKELCKNRQGFDGAVTSEALNLTCDNLLKECIKKKNLNYKCSAINALGMFVQCSRIKNSICLDQVLALAESRTKSGDSGDSSDEDTAEKTEGKIRVVIAAMDSCARIAASSGEASDRQRTFAALFAIGKSNSFWKVKRHSLMSLNILISESCAEITDVSCAQLFGMIVTSVGDSVHLSLVEEATTLLACMCRAILTRRLVPTDLPQCLKEIDRLSVMKPCQEEQLQTILQSIKSAQ